MKNMQLNKISGLLLGSVLFASSWTAFAQGTGGPRAFDSAEAAVKALIAATAADDEAALVDIVGSNHRSVVVTPDRAQSREFRLRFAKAAEQYRVLRTEKDGRVTLIVGTEAWPLPIPLVQTSGSWKFDAAAGAVEIANRRVGSNELATIGVMASYGEAQRKYAAKPRDGTEVRQFAQRLVSASGKKDGLYWDADVTKGEELSPFGPLVREGTRERGDPYNGYYYKVLKGQGPAAPGGRYSYVINGRMVAGYALLAYPAEYGITGAKSFIVNHYGVVYEKDLGKNSAAAAAGMTEYNPDKSWSAVAD